MTGRIRRCLLAGLSLIGVGLVVGIGGTAIAMVQAIHLASGLSGEDKVKVLADGIRLKIIFTSVGGMVFLIGIALMFGALYFHCDSKPRGE